MTRYITNSELQTYKDCHRKWWLSFHRKLRPKRLQLFGPLPIGTRVHYALQALYEPTPRDPIEAYDQMATDDRNRLDAFWLGSEYGPPMDDIKRLNDEIELGRIMVRGYLEWLVETCEDSTFEVVGSEQKVAVPFSTFEDVSLLGKLDVRIRRKTDGARLFIDHKTCGSIESFLQTAQLNEQFLHYQLLERLLGLATGETAQTQGSMVNLLRKVKRTATAKPPFYYRAEIHHSDLELRNYYERVFHEVHSILSLERALEKAEKPAQVAFPRPSRDCTWKCEFKNVCPMFDDGSDAERFLADNFEVYDPLSRYDESQEATE